VGKEVVDLYGPGRAPAALGPNTGVVVATIEKANAM
jgi:hypothetical protein